MKTLKVSNKALQLINGLIINSQGRHYTSYTNDGKIYQTVSRGKKTEFVVGDNVVLNIINDNQAQIMELSPRKNLIYRSDQNRSKMIASNLDQIIIVVAVKPNFNINFLNSCLIAAESSEITPLILINKMDLPESAIFASELIDLYSHKLGYQIITQSAIENCTTLLPLLHGKRSVLIGQSGVGKSTITNQISPNANARTGDIAKHENSGRHTTTNATLYHIEASTELIDCPGLQEFGLFHIDIHQLAEFFPEMRQYLGQCKYNNCLHLNEPQCTIINAHKNNDITDSRYIFYSNLCTRLKQKKNY